MLHEHCPVDVSHIPALLQSEGQVNSTKENQNGYKLLQIYTVGFGTQQKLYFG